MLSKLAPIHPLVATAEALRWAIHPPQPAPSRRWRALLQGMPIAPADLERLLAAGMVPIRLSPGDVPAYGGDVPGGCQLLDAEYGVTTVFDRGTIRTPGVDLGMLFRYVDSGFQARGPQEIFDIGARRGQEALGSMPGGYEGPVTRTVRSRGQLDRLLDDVRSHAEESGLQMWLRGQPQHYEMPDVTDLARRGLCPIRDDRDASQVPSMYRGVDRRIDDLRGYCRWLLQIHTYYLFLRETLGLSEKVTRRPGEEPVELLLGGPWGVGPELTIARKVGDEVYEHADVHMAHAQARAALFLQHYGIESNVLDVTDDTDVALFFARNRIENGRYVPVTMGSPVIYVFLLDPELDRVAPTTDLIGDLEVLRPVRQRCGVLGGASLVSRNFYARFVAARFILDFSVEETASADYLFPGPEEDRVLHGLQVFQEELSLDLAKPFALASS